MNNRPYDDAIKCDVTAENKKQEWINATESSTLVNNTNSPVLQIPVRGHAWTQKIYPTFTPSKCLNWQQKASQRNTHWITCCRFAKRGNGIGSCNLKSLQTSSKFAMLAWITGNKFEDVPPVSNKDWQNQKTLIHVLYFLTSNKISNQLKYLKFKSSTWSVTCSECKYRLLRFVHHTASPQIIDVIEKVTVQPTSKE